MNRSNRAKAYKKSRNWMVFLITKIIQKSISDLTDLFKNNAIAVSN